MTLAVTKGAILGVQTEPLRKRFWLVEHLKRGERLVGQWAIGHSFQVEPSEKYWVFKSLVNRVGALGRPRSKALEK